MINKMYLISVLIVAGIGLLLSWLFFPTYDQMSLMLFYDRRYEEAYPRYEKMFQSHEYTIQAIMPLVWLDLKFGYGEKAIQIMEDYLNKHPDDIEVRKYLGTLYQETDRIYHYFLNLQEIYRLQPSFDIAKVLLELSEAFNDVGQQMKTLEEIVAHYIPTPENFHTLAYLYAEQGNLKLALNTIQEMLVRLPLSDINVSTITFAMTVFFRSDENQKAKQLARDYLDVRHTLGSSLDIFYTLLNENLDSEAMRLLDSLPQSEQNSQQVFIARINGLSNLNQQKEVGQLLLARFKAGDFPEELADDLFNFALSQKNFALLAQILDQFSANQISDHLLFNAINQASQENQTAFIQTTETHLNTTYLKYFPLVKLALIVAHSPSGEEGEKQIKGIYASEQWTDQQESRLADLFYKKKYPVLTRQALGAIQSLEGFNEEEVNLLIPLYIDLGMVDKGFALIDQTRLNKSSDSPMTDYAWAILAASTGRFEEVEEWLQTQTYIDEITLTDLFRIALNKNQPKLAVKVALWLENEWPSVEHKKMLVEAYIANGQEKEALEILKQLREKDAKVSALYINVLRTLAKKDPQYRDELKEAVLAESSPAPTFEDPHVQEILDIWGKQVDQESLGWIVKHAQTAQGEEKAKWLNYLIDLGEMRLVLRLTTEQELQNPQILQSYQNALQTLIGTLTELKPKGLASPFELRDLISYEIKQPWTTAARKKEAVDLLIQHGWREEASHTLQQLADKQPFSSEEVQSLLSLWGERPSEANLHWIKEHANAASGKEKAEWLQYLIDLGQYKDAYAQLSEEDLNDSQLQQLYLTTLEEVANRLVENAKKDPSQKASLIEWFQKQIESDAIPPKKKRELATLLFENGWKEEAFALLMQLNADEPFNSEDVQAMLALIGKPPSEQALAWIKERALLAHGEEKANWIQLLMDLGQYKQADALISPEDLDNAQMKQIYVDALDAAVNNLVDQAKHNPEAASELVQLIRREMDSNALPPEKKRELASLLFDKGFKQEAFPLLVQLNANEPFNADAMQAMLALIGNKPSGQELAWMIQRARSASSAEEKAQWIQHLIELGQVQEAYALISLEDLDNDQIKELYFNTVNDVLAELVEEVKKNSSSQAKLDVFLNAQLFSKVLSSQKKKEMAIALFEKGFRKEALQILTNASERRPFKSQDVQEILWLFGDTPSADEFEWIKQRIVFARGEEKAQWLQHLVDIGHYQDAYALISQQDLNDLSISKVYVSVLNDMTEHLVQVVKEDPARRPELLSLINQQLQLKFIAAEKKRELAQILLDQGLKEEGMQAFQDLARNRPFKSEEVQVLVELWGDHLQGPQLEWIRQRARFARADEKAQWLQYLNELGKYEDVYTIVGKEDWNNSAIQKAYLSALQELINRWSEEAKKEPSRRSEIEFLIAAHLVGKPLPDSKKRELAHLLLDQGWKEEAQGLLLALAEQQAFNGEDVQALLEAWGKNPQADTLAWIVKKTLRAAGKEKGQWLSYLIELKQLEKAVELIEEQDLFNDQILELYVDTLIKLKRRCEAEEALSKAIKQEFRINRLQHLGKFANDHSLKTAAQESYAKVLAFFPEDAASLKQMGLLAFEANQYSAAEHYLRRYFEEKPEGDYQTNYFYGELLYGHGNHTFGAIIKTNCNKKRSQVYFLKALAQIQALEKKDQAIQQIEAQIYYRLGDTNHAIALYECLLEHHRADLNLRTDFASLLMEIQDYDRAAFILSYQKEPKQELEEETPVNWEVAQLTLLKDEEHLKEALCLSAQLMEKYPCQTSVLAAAADVENTLDRWRLAAELYDAAIELEPLNESYYYSFNDVIKEYRPFVFVALEHRETDLGLGDFQSEDFVRLLYEDYVYPFTKFSFFAERDDVIVDAFTNLDGEIKSFRGVRYRGFFGLRHYFRCGSILDGMLYFGRQVVGGGLHWLESDAYGHWLFAADYHQPNWDFVETLIEGGSRDRFLVGRTLKIWPRWTLEAALFWNQYNLHGFSQAVVSYGQEVHVAYQLSSQNCLVKALGDEATVSINYLLNAEYANKIRKKEGSDGIEFAPLPFTDRQEHNLFLFVSKRFYTIVLVEAFGGYMYDYEVQGPLQPLYGINVIIDPNDDLEIRYEYNHETSPTQGGVVDRHIFSIKYRF